MSCPCDDSHSTEICRARLIETEQPGITCFVCNRKGHITCRSVSQGKRAFCFNCGERGHPGTACRHSLKGTREGRKLYYEMIQQVDIESSDEDRPMSSKERRYFKKLQNKAFKKLTKKSKHRKRHKSN
mmetsp:Transcript_1773/g.3834  ORF Transcript_1773/g.3834 Transcript_1773/m.3834 type:complete len:128 (+) Transcript_1773:5080-5463(+)